MRCFCLLLFLIVIFTGCQSDTRNVPETFPHVFLNSENMACLSTDCIFEYRCSIPQVPFKIMVYKNKIKNVNESNLRELADKFDMQNMKIKLPNSVSGVEDLNGEGKRKASISLYNNNIEEFVYRNIKADLTSPKENLPSKKKAIELAKSYLKEKKLFPKDTFVEKVGYGMVHITGDAEPGKTHIYVLFKRKINGLPCESSKIKVILLPDNNVGELYYFMWDWEPIGQYPILSPAEAIAYAKNSQGRLMQTPQGSAAGIKITGDTDILHGELNVMNFFLAYWRSPELQDTTYLQPVYVVEGTDKAGDYFKLYIPALKK